MINNQIIEYIRGQLGAKVSRDTIAANLRSAGWSEGDIAEAFNALTPVAAVVASPKPTQPIQAQPVAQAVSPITPVQPIQPIQPAQPVPPIQPAVNTMAHATAQTSSLNMMQTPIIPAQAMMAQNPPVISQPAVYQPPHHKLRNALSIIVVVIVLLAAGAGAYGYYTGMFVSFPQLTSQAIDKIHSATSATYDTTVSIDLSQLPDLITGPSQLLSGGLTSSQIMLTTKGSYDVSDPANKKSSIAISLDSGSVSLAGEIRFINHIIYGQITKAPVFALIPQFASYENKWYSYPYNSDGSLPANPLSSFGGVSTTLESKLTEDQKAHIFQMSKDASIIKMLERLAPETITAESSYHYTFVLDQAGIAAYLQNLKYYVNSIGKDDSALSAFDPTTLSKGFDQIKNFQGEVWIGRKDKLPRKVSVNFGIKIDPTKDAEVKVTAVSIFSNWNQPALIMAPAESTSLSDIFSNSFGAARGKGQDAQIKSIFSNMRAQGELYYDIHNSSYKGVCADNIIMQMGNAVKDAGGTSYICKDIVGAFVASAKLITTPGYWCIDNTGASKEVKTLPTGLSCPLQ